MGIIQHSERPVTTPYPGVTRQTIVCRETGAGALTTSYLVIEPGATVRVHTHKVEEAMLVSQGEGIAILGNEEVPVKAPTTVLAPAGVRHGFRNTGSVPMVVSGIFPALDVEIIFEDA